MLLLILAALMYVQFQWTTQVTDAARAHVAADLRRSILAWHLDLFRSFASPSIALQLNSEADDDQNKAAYAKRFRQWRALALHSSLVSNIYLWSFYNQPQGQIQRLDVDTGIFVPVAWPEKFDSLRRRLQRKSLVLALAIAGASSPEQFFSDHPQENRPFQIGNETVDVLGGWVFDSTIPALFHPVAHEDSNPYDGVAESRLSADWIVIEYDQDVLRKELLPELAQRYFSGRGELEYQLAVAVGSDQNGFIYSSESTSAKVTQPDATMSLFGPKQIPALKFSPAEQTSVEDYEYSESQQSYNFRGAFWFPIIYSQPGNQDWYLIVKHRHGSLNESFSRLRRRDLAIGYGILLLLVASLGLVLIATRRAQELARLQVDFVTGVSHDLRTPLSVISLAAENLADGLIVGREAVARYGVTMQFQVRQLIQRVEQVLSFAAMNRNKATYTLAPAEASEIIQSALRSTELQLKAAGVESEVQVDAGLPLVLTDAGAMSQVLQNLITNAINYGGHDGWVGIRATAAKGNEDKPAVQIAVADHGIGIERSDLNRIFEPFYRSRSVIATQIRGTGLGLTLAKSAIEALGGSISVSSSPGKGTTFIVHLPAAHSLAAATGAAVVASS